MGRRPLCAAVFVGGRSLRMGSSKARLRIGGETLVERACRIVRPYVQSVAVSGDDGAGERDAPLADVEYVADVPGVSGPLAGLLAVLEHDRTVDWLVLACDMPGIQTAAIEWIIAQHERGAAATLARLAGRKRCETMLAIYGPAALPDLRAAADAGEPAVHRALEHVDVCVCQPPAEIAVSWRNVNTPQDWAAFVDRPENN